MLDSSLILGCGRIGQKRSEFKRVAAAAPGCSTLRSALEQRRVLGYAVQVSEAQP